MKILTIIGEILPVLGTIGLLGLWLFQQTEVERRSGELRKLASARTVFQTYQSNNAVFNAINELSKKDKVASEQLRRFQVYNYELGLQAIEEALPESDKADIPSVTSAYDPSGDIQTKLDQTQKRLEKLQAKLAEKEEAVRQSADIAKRRYLWFYLGLSVISIFGAVCKIIDKLSAAHV